MQTAAITDVLAERRWQVEHEKWSIEHDDSHCHGELAKAAACYTLGTAERYWPWSRAWWKPQDRRTSLVKAGALILAEIERLDRAKAALETGKD